MNTITLRIATASALALAIAALVPVSSIAAPASIPAAFVLDEPSLPGYDAATATAVAQSLRRAGYLPQFVKIEDLLQASSLAPDRCALLAIPQARALPTAIVPQVESYMSHGGALLALGSPMWSTALFKDDDGKWTTQEELLKRRALQAPTHKLYDFSSISDVGAWHRVSNDETYPVEKTLEAISVNGRTANALHASVSNLTGWEILEAPAVAAPFPEGNTMTVFSAKGDAHTKALSIEWVERNGDRWIATVPLTEQWQGYAVLPSEFHAWQIPGGRTGRGFQPSEAVTVKFGLAFSHTGSVGGAHDYWIANIGTAPASAKSNPLQTQINPPLRDAVSPDYKFFPISAGAVLKVSGGQSIVANAPVPTPSSAIWSPQPRPNGAGFDKQRGWRQISLITAVDSRTGQWRGTPGVLRIELPGAAAEGQVLASFAIDNPAFYRTKAGSDIIEQTALKMRNGLFLVDGGAQYYTAFENQPIRFGAQVVNLAPIGQDRRQRAVVKVLITGSGGRTVWSKEWPIDLGRTETASVSDTWTPPAVWPDGGYVVSTDLLENGAVVDSLRHTLSVWTAPEHPDFMTISPDGHFSVHGRPWKALGVNYMPSSGIGVEHGKFFEQWLSAQSYDPEIIERDLSHIEDIGANCISVFIYAKDIETQNLLDLFRRARAHHLYVNLSLRPVLREYRSMSDDAGLAQTLQNQATIINYYHLWQNDTVFAYDVDWEPSFGPQKERGRLDGAWTAWVQLKYGSVDEAQKAWNFTPPTDASGALTGPTDEQVGKASGPVSKMVVDYRRFLDTWLIKMYGGDREGIRKLDPHHFVSFRMSETGDPTHPDSWEMAYQFTGLAKAVDFLAPEGYGRIGDWNRVKPGLFELAYARAVAPNLPVLWAEVGTSTANVQSKFATDDTLTVEGQFYKDFLNMSRLGGADGVIFWWYPGGYRVGENSDFGLINPDGTDRAATTSFRTQGAAFLKAPFPPAPDVWLPLDPDPCPDGISGIYKKLSDSFFSAIENGRRPGLQARH